MLPAAVIRRLHMLTQYIKRNRRKRRESDAHGSRSPPLGLVTLNAGDRIMARQKPLDFWLERKPGWNDGSVKEGEGLNTEKRGKRLNQ
ncbi:hypothetical protein D3C76_01620 [compost metagenome]